MKKPSVFLGPYVFIFMIDLALLRTPEGFQNVLQSEIKRGGAGDRVQRVRDAHEKRIKIRFEMETLSKEINTLSKECQKHYKARNVTAETENIQKKVLLIKEKKAECAARLKAIEEETEKEAREIGNLLHPEVAVSNNEDDNPVIKEVPWIKKDFFPNTPLPFDVLLEKLGAADSERGAKISGHRGYFLKGPGVVISLALSRYALDFLAGKGHELIQTPFMMRKEIMQKTAQLSDFDDQLYKIEGEIETYLIATSEQPISALHSDEWLAESELPLQYAGFSTCFRKEAGAHGKDNRGIFRVHQFEKVEQFVIASPEKSENAFRSMVSNAEEFYSSLGVGYRVVSIVSGALNNAAAVKYDLEAYFPASARYRELVSCSNCTDYQSRDLNVRYEVINSGDQTKKFVHMLNGTLCAIQRTLCCLLEVYQTPEGIKVPDVLIPYTKQDFFPFAKRDSGKS